MSCNSQELSVVPNDSVNSIWVDVVSALQFDLFNIFSVECPYSVHLHQWHRSVRVFDEPWCKKLDEVDEHECGQLHNFDATRKAGLLLKGIIMLRALSRSTEAHRSAFATSCHRAAFL